MMIFRVKCVVCDTMWTEKEGRCVDTDDPFLHRFTMIGHSGDTIDVAPVCSSACARQLLDGYDKRKAALKGVFGG